MASSDCCSWCIYDCTDIEAEMQLTFFQVTGLIWLVRMYVEITYAI